MDKRKDPSSVDIKGILLDMRKYRMGLIQTPDQLRFSYMAVLEGAKYIMGDSSVQVPAPRTPGPVLSFILTHKSTFFPFEALETWFSPIFFLLEFVLRKERVSELINGVFFQWISAYLLPTLKEGSQAETQTVS